MEVELIKVGSWVSSRLTEITGRNEWYRRRKGYICLSKGSEITKLESKSRGFPTLRFYFSENKKVGE